MDAHATQQVAEVGSKYQDLAWMVLASPLICGAGSWFLSRRLRGLTAGFNIAGVLLSLMLGVILLGISADHPLAATAFHWLPIPGLDLTIGLRVAEEEEREGLDISSHGETAYSK